MRHLSRARIGALLLSAGLVVSVTGVARADDLTADQGTTDTAPVALDTESDPNQVVWVTLVAADDDGHDGCNLENEQNPQGHHFFASVVSNATSVATVDPAILEFTACGPAGAKSFTITGVGAGSTTITIAKDTSRNAGGGNAVFSTETVYVTVTGDDGGGGITVCDGPAAPAWAAHILKANGKPKKQSDAANYVSQVAKRMDTGASFLAVNDTTLVAKSQQPAYSAAVLAYLNRPGAFNGTLTFPTGWPPPNQCTTTGTA